MAVSNDDMLQIIATAQKSITTTDLGSSILQPAFFNQYVVEATEQLTVLSEARMIEMQSQQQNIDRVGFSGRFLQPGGEGVSIDPANDKKPTFSQNKLEAKELMGATGIYDTTLRRTVEGQNFQNTLISLFSNQSNLDLEAFCMFGDKDKYTAGSLLKLTDGWIKNAYHKLYGLDAADGDPKKDFDPTKITDMFDKMIAAYPKAYLSNPSQMRIYVSWDLFEAYRNYVITRTTGMGDIALTTDWTPIYKGIVIKYAPVLEDSEGKGVYGNVAMLVNPSNLCYGIFHQITVEPDRVARARRTDWIVTLEADADYENEKAVVVALPEINKPEA